MQEELLKFNTRTRDVVKKGVLAFCLVSSVGQRKDLESQSRIATQTFELQALTLNNWVMDTFWRATTICEMETLKKLLTVASLSHNSVDKTQQSIPKCKK